MKPKRYRALHITPGIVDYTDGDQRETVLIRKQALDKMNRSFLGKPVFNFTHKNIDPEEAFDFTSEDIEKHADGVISNVGYDVESGYYFADMMIWDEETQRNIDDEGYKVSNAYIPQVSEGGIYNNVSYDEEVIDGEYYHMAIVEEPRYGDVKIFENSKKGKAMKFKLFGGKKDEKAKENQSDAAKKNMKGEEDKDKGKEEMTMNMDSVLVDDEGNEMMVSEMVEAYKAQMQPEDEDKPMVNMDDTMEIDGKEVSMKELYDNYCAKKNAEPPTDEPLEPSVDESMKKNSSGGEKPKPNENFLKLKANANKGEEKEKINVNTERNRLKVGQARYGSAVVAEGGK